jgi:hypothetical protein
MQITAKNAAPARFRMLGSRTTRTSAHRMCIFEVKRIPCYDRDKEQTGLETDGRELLAADAAASRRLRWRRLKTARHRRKKWTEQI